LIANKINNELEEQKSSLIQLKGEKKVALGNLFSVEPR
jgi:hypothetical protein